MVVDMGRCEDRTNSELAKDLDGGIDAVEPAVKPHIHHDQIGLRRLDGAHGILAGARDGGNVVARPFQRIDNAERGQIVVLDEDHPARFGLRISLVLVGSMAWSVWTRRSRGRHCELMINHNLDLNILDQHDTTSTSYEIMPRRRSSIFSCT
jgi:hypothetical protein